MLVFEDDRLYVTGNDNHRAFSYIFGKYTFITREKDKEYLISAWLTCYNHSRKTYIDIATNRFVTIDVLEICHKYDFDPHDLSDEDWLVILVEL